MADDFSDILKQFEAAMAKAESFQSDGKKVLAGLTTLKKDLEAFKFAGPNLKKKGWLKAAETAGADKQIIAALKSVESSSSRASCEAAFKLLKGEKSLKKIADEIQAVLQSDEKTAKDLTKTLAEAKALAAGAEKLQAAGKSVSALYGKGIKDGVDLLKEMKST